MIVALSIIISVFLVITLTGAALSGPAYKGPITDHFDGNTFINPGGVKQQSLGAVFKWMFTRKRSSWRKPIDDAAGAKPVDHVHSGIRITFVNHSTFLIQTEGLNILTDPVWSERVSPFTWSGPKRQRKPGIRFEDLPRIDIILLSHNHYDHLDLPTLKSLARIHDPRIITSLGVSAYLKKNGIEHSVDMDWWDELKLIENVWVQSVPAQHFSARGTLDRNKTLWCGFVLKRKEGNIYFAGDTGYNTRTFKEIGDRCSPVAVSLIPIGAYQPIWFMSPVHCSPAEAVKIHKEVRSKKSIATHFGTFRLGDESPDDAVRDLKNALVAEKIPDDAFITMQEGESREF
jgi:L-ascorbate metabolism protein UlaG (beta-lactamase superfamily)